MRNALIFGLFLGSIYSCLNPRLDEQDFFEVSMEMPRPISVGAIQLKGYCTSSGMDVCGFYYSDNADQLAPAEIESADSVQCIQSADRGFQYVLDGLSQQQTLYFKSFAQKDGRKVYSDLQTYSSGQLVRMNGSLARSNDTLLASAVVSGLGLQAISADSHGFVYSYMHNLPEVGRQDCTVYDLGDLNDDIVFNSKIPGIKFNKRYFVRAYIGAGGLYYYSDRVDSIDIGGGWKQVADLSTAYHGGVAIGGASANKAFVGFGCDVQPCYQSNLPDTIFNYTPDNTGGVWSNNQHTAFQNAEKGTDVAVFQIENTLCFFGGEAIVQLGANEVERQMCLGQFKKYDMQSGMWSVENFNLPPPRSRAVAFSIGNKGYIGAGTYVSGGVFKERNDFWQYSPQTNSWRRVASLPLRTSPSTTSNGGRTNAAVFYDSNRVFVAGGFSGATYLQDVWQFIPPATDSPQDSGVWNFVTLLDFPGRSEASFFSIGDKGYYGLGYNGSTGTLDDFYEFDFDAPSVWTPITPFPGGRRRHAISFSLSNRGYVLGGTFRIFTPQETGTEGLLRDFWQYEPKQ